MKKISLLLVGLTAIFCLTGCKKEGDIDTHPSINGGMVRLCDHYLDNASYISFIRDTYTDNISMTYFEKQGYGGGGGLLPYYNSNGEIMKYTEFKQVHKH